jgi:superoxide dismutase, Cu-Zn family
MLLRSLALLAPLTMITACTNSIEVAPTDAISATATPSGWTVYQGSPSAAPATLGTLPPDTVAAGTFMPYRKGAAAVTYDPTVVPAGATAQVAITGNGAGMVVRLTANGLIPRRAYGAHLHTRPCAAAPDAAGPHYQHHKDPAAAASPPSVNPSYANPANEVWLDLVADAGGAATVASSLTWRFQPGAGARSLVLHAMTTRTGAGVAGSAGPRVACLSLPG